MILFDINKLEFEKPIIELEQKIDDIGMLKALTQATSSVSLHIPWDIPSNAEAIKSQATELGIKFNAVNSNTFQDQQDQSHSYKFGSCHTVALLGL